MAGGGMIRSVAFLWLMLAVAVSGALFRVSYRVQHLEQHLASVNKKIGGEEETTRVLQAEWSYLNDPTRLEALARKHLALMPMSPSQIVNSDLVPSRNVVPGNASTHGTKTAAPATRPLLANLKTSAHHGAAIE